MTIQVRKRFARLCATVMAIGWMSLATPARSAPMTAGFTNVEARYASGQNRTRSNPDAVDPAARAIDGNLSTETYLTSSFTSGPVFIYLDLGTATYLSGLRIHKFSNEYGSHTLAIDYSTGTGPLANRVYSTVGTLQGGFEGTEVPVFAAGGGIVGNSLVRENGAASSPYIYSATFSGVNQATALRLTLTDESVNTHLRVSEIQAIVPEPACGTLLVIASALLSCKRRRIRGHD